MPQVGGLDSRRADEEMDLIDSMLAASAAVHVMTLVALAAAGRARAAVSVVSCAIALVIGGGVGYELARRIVRPGEALLGAAIAIAVPGAYAVLRRRDLHAAGALVWSSMMTLGALAGLRALLFIVQMHVSPETRWLLVAGIPFVAIGLPASIVTQREALEALIRRRWRRQHEPMSGTGQSRLPFVSIHVPCRSEPADLVISTLDHLSRLDYPAFEVLVVDNNTDDPGLWQPVEEHCGRLGERFRFFHVEGLTGAKAGALNWVAQHVHADAELIGVVDADYHVAPGWLMATVGFFEDPTVGFVQPPHAYRDWEGSRFGRMANWEYSVFFATGMVALQEHGAGITVGTMSVVRRTALEDAGGWAEWCLTEDSELAIRVHELGYRSVYLREPFGWGLIPATFDGYRTQRFRWTYGPVQELRHHWRGFLPARLGGAERLSLSQRIHHANHGLDVAIIGIRLLSWPLALAAGASLVLHHEHVSVPFELWLAVTALLVSGLVIRWLQYCRVTGAPLAGAIGALVAYQALGYTIAVASWRAVLGRPAAWHRTDKFQKSRRLSRGVGTTVTESAIAVVLITGAFVLIGYTRGGLATMLAIGLGVQGLGFACTPVVALIAEHSLVSRRVTARLARKVTAGDAEDREPAAVTTAA